VLLAHRPTAARLQSWIWYYNHRESLETYIKSVFGVSLPKYNTSTDVDIRNLTNLDVEQFRQIIEQFAKPDRATEAILLKHQWEG